MHAAKQGTGEPAVVLRTSQALAAALRGGGELKLDLSPEQLGRINVRMNPGENGVSIVLTCHEPETARVLEARLPSLRQSLEAQGIVAGPISVQVHESAVPQAQPAAADQSPLPDTGSSDIGSSPQGDAQSGQFAQDRSARDAHRMADADSTLIEVPVSLGTGLAMVHARGFIPGVDMTV
jgi:flagellar hook-length control protein FliK